jgi:hypothetical protein
VVSVRYHLRARYVLAMGPGLREVGGAYDGRVVVVVNAIRRLLVIWCMVWIVRLWPKVEGEEDIGKAFFNLAMLLHDSAHRHVK